MFRVSLPRCHRCCYEICDSLLNVSSCTRLLIQCDKIFFRCVRYFRIFSYYLMSKILVLPSLLPLLILMINCNCHYGLRAFLIFYCSYYFFFMLHSAFAWVFFSWIKFHSLRRTLKKAEKILYITIQYILILFHNEFLNHISLQTCFMHSNMNLHVDCWCFVLLFFSLFIFIIPYLCTLYLCILFKVKWWVTRQNLIRFARQILVVDA